MKKLIILPLLALALVACKKEEEEPIPVEPPVEPTPQVTITEQGSNDESARTEYDKSIGDAMSALESVGFGSRSAQSLPCGVVRVDTAGGIYNVVYGGNCGRKKLSGNIVATLKPDSAKWRDAGTSVTLEYQNYKVLFEANNEVLIFNGTITVTNVNGGLIYSTILLKQVVEHKIRGTLEVTFDNGAKRNWRIFKKRVYQAQDGKVDNLAATIAADSGSIAEIGVNRAGENFTTTIPTDFLYENCNGKGSWIGPYILTQGKMVYTAGNNSVTAVPGYTLENNTMKSLNDCNSDGYKLTWNINGAVTEQFLYY